MSEAAASLPDALLDVRDLVTAFDTDAGTLTAVDGVSFKVRAGKTLGMVGESGCGKSVTALSVMRLLPKPMGRILNGEVLFEGENLLKRKPVAMQAIRGRKIGMVFQEPMTALNPVQRVGRQLAEVLHLHHKVQQEEARRRSIELLDMVGIPSPDVRINDYPHQLSGGMRQRVVIAMALACKPTLLIADEPSTALDVTVQAQILELIKSLQRELGMAVLLITHDLGVVAEMCDDVVVMYAGQIVEEGSVTEIFDRPTHPYTHALLESVPRLDSTPKTRLPTIEGMVPSLDALPKGCRFQGRCPYFQPVCEEPVALETVDGAHRARCRRWREIDYSGEAA